MEELSKHDQADVFHYSLKLALGQCNYADVPDKLKPFMEDQYKGSTGFHRRNQTSFPSSFNKSKSFGGVSNGGNKGKKRKQKKVYESRQDKISNLIDGLDIDDIVSEGKQQVVKRDGAFLAPRRGQFIINGKVVIGDHATILKALVGWFIDNDLQSLQDAISGIKNQIEGGAPYAQIKDRQQQQHTDDDILHGDRDE